MNRRQALLALAAIPGFTRITADKLTPQSVIVLEFKGRLTLTQAEEVRVQARTIWPDNKVVVLGEGTTLRVITR